MPPIMPHATPFPLPSPRRKEPDVQWLERMYNNRLRVPEHARYFERWTAESARVRATLPCETDVPYGTGSDEMLDVFAAPRAGAPVVVFVHGDWKSVDKSRHAFVVPALRALGAMVVLPGHMPAPRATVPDITLQLARAVAWSWRNASRHGGDARRLVVIGHAAGGQLAAMMLACAWDVFDAELPARVVQGAMGLSGLYDLGPLMHTPSLQEALRLTPQQVAQASPARLSAPAHGVFLGVVGGAESGEFQRQNRLLQQAWGRARVPVAAALPGLNHYDVLDALASPGERLRRLLQRLLR